MRSHLSIAIAILLTTLVALPCSAPFSTCTLADILGSQHDEVSVGQGAVATIGTVTVTDDAPEPGPPRAMRLRASLTMSAAAPVPVLMAPWTAVARMPGRSATVRVHETVTPSTILRV